MFFDKYLESFYEMYPNSDEITVFKILKPLINLEIYQKYYDKTKEELYSYIIPKISYIKTKYGNLRWYNNHLCRSDGEYSIAKFLVNNDVNYIYEKFYNKNINKMKSDFYLIDYDLHIEYCGMVTKNNKYTIKKTFLINNNITNVFFSSKIEEIKTKILNLINENHN